MSWYEHLFGLTTEVYLQTDPTAKLETLEAVIPPSLRKGTFSPPDKLIASEESKRAHGVSPRGRLGRAACG